MADASFDVIVIGGGHQGLIAGTYLAMNGMTVGVFEQRHEIGGGAATEQRPLAGFIGNPHAHVAGFWAAPMNQDFKLYEKGLEYIFPEVMASIVFPNDTCIVTYRSIEVDQKTGVVTTKPEIIDRNLKEIARISPIDAERTAAIIPRIQKWFDVYNKVLYNPPPLPGEPDLMEDLINDKELGMDPRYPFMTATEIVCDLFTSPEMQVYALRQLGSNGIYPDDVAPAPLLISNPGHMLGISALAVFQGGTHNVAHALQRAFSEQGGKFYVGAEVDQILIQNGRARGVRLVDGTEIEAKKLVVSSIEVKQTVRRHLRDLKMDSNIRRKIDNVRTDRGNIFWGQIAYNELPNYRAVSWNPDCAKGRWVFMGEPDLEYLYREYRYRCQSVRPGVWPPKMYIWEATDSKFDPRYAPPGKHVALIEECAPPASWLSEKEWLQVRKEVPGQILKEWQKYAPNMTWDNVIAATIDTPLDSQQRSANFVDGSWAITAHCPSQWGKFRPIPEFAQYQVPGLENFYMASGSCHFSLGLMGWASYNCYKRMAQHLGLRKFWEEQGRAY